MKLTAFQSNLSSFSNSGNSIKISVVRFGGLGVTCSPHDQWLAGSNPAEVDGLFQDVKILREGL